MADDIHDFRYKESIREGHRERAREKVALNKKESEDQRAIEARERLSAQIQSTRERQERGIAAQTEKTDKQIATTLIRDEDKRMQSLAEAEAKNATTEKVEQLRQKGDLLRLKMAAAFRAQEMKAELQIQQELSAQSHEQSLEMQTHLANLRIGEAQELARIHVESENWIRDKDQARTLEILREEQRNSAYSKILDHKIEKDRMTHENKLKMDFERFKIELAMEYKQYSFDEMLGAIRDLEPTFGSPNT